VLRVVALLAAASALATTGCSQSSAGNSGGADVDAACVPHDGVYTCLNGTWPVCPTSAKPEDPCDYSLRDCMGCAVGEGYTCTCSDSGVDMVEEGGASQDAALWFCIGTLATCQ
jgi:hypothetical protein